MTLLDLPVEIFHAICSESELSEIKNFRLVCRVFADVGAEYLLVNLHVHFARESLDKIEQIARHPGLAKSVRSLYFEADRLPELNDYGEWNKKRTDIDIATGRRYPRPPVPTLQEMADLGNTRRGERLLGRKFKVLFNGGRTYGRYTKRQLRAAYDEYRQLFRDEQLLEAEDVVRSKLLALFGACPNLDAAVLSLGRQFCKCTTETVPSFQRAMVCPCEDDPEGTTGVYALLAMLQAIGESDAYIPCIAAGPLSHAFFARALQPEYIESTTRAVSRVRDLDIQLEGLDEDTKQDIEQYIETASDGSISRFLSHAQEIRELTFMSFAAYPHDTQMRLKDAIGEVKWQHLTSLQLSSFDCEDMELPRLLLRHSDTLQSLHLGALNLPSGNWPKNINAFAGKLPLLKDVVLQGTFRSPFGDLLIFGYKQSSGRWRRSIESGIKGECPLDWDRVNELLEDDSEDEQDIDVYT